MTGSYEQLHAIQQLQQRQSLPLRAKIVMSQNRIKQWYEYWDGLVYISFSGGKDSTVLLDLVREIYPEVPAVFCDTGLEYPEIRAFVRTFDNVTWLRPAMNFRETLTKYGYPVISKEQAKYIREVQRGTTEYMRNKRLHGKNGSRTGMISYKWQYLINAPFKVDERCCDVMKKRPMHQYFRQTGRYPYIGTMAGESSARQQVYIRYGCNAFNTRNPMSRPLTFWNEPDVWAYLREHNLPYSRIYDMGEDRTGCMFCMFGVHLEKPPNRFQRMQKTHPKQWDYCMNKLGLAAVLDYINVPWKN